MPLNNFMKTAMAAQGMTYLLRNKQMKQLTKCVKAFHTLWRPVISNWQLFAIVYARNILRFFRVDEKDGLFVIVSGKKGEFL